MCRLPIAVVFLSMIVPTGDVAPELQPHACVPVATSMVLRYFDRDVKFADVRVESDVAEDGSASISSIIDGCQRRGLKAAAYRDVSGLQLKSWLQDGFAIVCVPASSASNHAVVLFGPEMFVSDLLTPLHRADQKKLAKFLDAGMICVVVGESEPQLLRWWLAAVSVGLVLGAVLIEPGFARVSGNPQC